MDSNNFSDTLVRLNNSEKYIRNFPENPRDNRKSQSPNLSVYQEIVEKKNTLSSAALTTVWKIQRVEENAMGGKGEAGVRGNLYFCYVAEFSYFLTSWLALCWEWIYVSNTEDWRKLRAWTDSNGLVRMNPAGLSGPARFPQTLLAVLKQKRLSGTFGNQTVWPRERKSDNYYYYRVKKRRKKVRITNVSMYSNRVLYTMSRM